MENGLKVFAGNSNRSLAEEIAGYLEMTCGKAEVSKFPDSEIRVKILESVRGADIFLIQSTCTPSNDNIMELLIMLDAFRRASARRITAVLPYFGYARQDRKDRPRVPITAKLMANLITSAGADRVLAMDLHAEQVQGFFDIPVDQLLAAPVLVDYFKKKGLKDLVVAATDVGGIKTAREFAERLGTPLAIVDKRRKGPTEVEAMNLIGKVRGMNVIIPDDIIATAGSLSEAVNFLKHDGAKDIYACCTHPVFAGPAIQRLAQLPIRELVVTNTIPVPPADPLKDKLVVLSVAPLFAEAIKRIHSAESVSTLFERMPEVNQ